MGISFLNLVLLEPVVLYGTIVAVLPSVSATSDSIAIPLDR
jgi:hypothetical protein